jgi:ATP-dependent Clp protease adaptor protein ClpS
MANPKKQEESGLDYAEETKAKKPRLYKVIILNDDFTPMEFVVHVLMKFFQKDEEGATRVMLEVHHKGAGIAGVYSKDIAETKMMMANQYAKNHEHPLKTITEPE